MPSGVTMVSAAAEVAAEPLTPELVAPEDLLRAQLYRLLAHFLSAPPGQTELEKSAALTGDASALGTAVSGFAQLSARITPDKAAEEYHDLFIGVARGELLPYGSYYLTGFLHEKPLSKLRADLAALGIESDPDVTEPEDHIAALTETMAGLIDGSLSERLSLAEQKAFFATHIGSWAPYFFRDLEGAKSSVLYAALGTIGRIFLEIEEAAFAMVQDDHKVREKASETN